MSDHDRGAYTPPRDAPLAFDARQGHGRRAFPTTLVISLVILAGLGVAIFMFYRSGVRGAGEAPVPVGAPIGDIKAPAPAKSETTPDAASGLQIYKSEGAAPAAASSPPVFTAPPEQPQPRPAPAPAAPVQVAPAPVHTVPAPQAAPAAPAAASTPTVSAAAVAASGATSKPASEPKPVATRPAPGAAPGDAIGDLLRTKPAAPAKPAPQPVPTAVTHGGALVQFGAFSSQALAGEQWAKLATRFGADMSGKGKVVEPVERNGKTLYRGAVSGFSSHADAVAFCAKLKAAGSDCIVR